jgi:hypothetical protein
MEEYLQKSLLIMNIEKNSINTLYFSTRNIENIQKQLILITRKNTGYTISKQNCNDLLTAMQYFYVNYPHFTVDVDMPDENVEKLNMLVLSDLVQQTVSGVKQHLEYLKYISKTPQPLDYGRSSSNKGENSLEFQNMGL